MSSANKAIAVVRSNLNFNDQTTAPTTDMSSTSSMVTTSIMTPNGQC
jgi:hypothetical protein